MPTFSHQELRELSASILEGIGAPPDIAALIGNSLVEANLVGHDSHGVLRLPTYCEYVRNGTVIPDARPVVAMRERSTARIDGAWGWGQPAMQLAAETALEIARESGMGAAVAERGFHIGRVAPYVELLAANGMVGIAMSNAGRGVAPYGGRDRILGTNPFAWSMPRGGGNPPLSFDIATAAIAEGKLRVAKSKGLQVAPGLLVDSEGLPSLDPDSFYDGGSILAFGGHKGSGFALLAQMLGHSLVGAGHPEDDGRRGGNEPIIIAIDVSAFTSLDAFTHEVDTECDLITNSTPAEGFTEVLLPGTTEQRVYCERSEGGIPVPETIWGELTALASELGVALKSA